MKRIHIKANVAALSSRAAFTLVELAMVLVILSLLVGGILAGQDLIRAAELRKVNTQYQGFTVAVQTFIDKYSGIPGDLKNATAYWGRQTGVCPTDSGTDAGPAGTCNGNGNGMVEQNPLTSGANEPLQFWHQLALAKLVEGSYTGVTQTGYWDYWPGINVPASIRTTGFATYYLRGWPQIPYGDGDVYELEYKHIFEFGTARTNARLTGPALTPREAQYIDAKFDDGKPAYGHIIARYWNNKCAAPNSGVASQTNYDASYRVSVDTIQCVLYFRNAY